MVKIRSFFFREGNCEITIEMKVNDFDIACIFYKSNDQPYSICVAHINKAFSLTYEQKLTFSALFNQAKHGPFSPEKAPDVGIFDFIGKERR